MGASLSLKNKSRLLISVIVGSMAVGAAASCASKVVGYFSPFVASAPIGNVILVPAKRHSALRYCSTALRAALFDFGLLPFCSETFSMQVNVINDK